MNRDPLTKSLFHVLLPMMCRHNYVARLLTPAGRSRNCLVRSHSKIHEWLLTKQLSRNGTTNENVARVAQSGQKICTEKRMSFVLEPRARYLNGWGSDHGKCSPIPTENG